MRSGVIFLGCDWPASSHVSALEPITVCKGMQLSHWLGLDHLTASVPPPRHLAPTTTRRWWWQVHIAMWTQGWEKRLLSQKLGVRMLLTEENLFWRGKTMDAHDIGLEGI